MRPIHTILSVIVGSTSLGVAATASAQQAEMAMPPPRNAADVVGPSQGPETLPAPDRTVSPINRPLLATGLVLFGGPYIASVIVAAESERPADQNHLFIPVVGPWLDLANRGTDVRPANNESANQALLILDGIGQGLGALAIVTSMFIPEKSNQHWYVIGDRRFHAMPTNIGSGYGVLGAGDF
jgi:hypothetical protein